VIAAPNENPSTLACNKPSTSCENSRTTISNQRPEINITMFDIPVAALLDSGASISAISETFLSTIKNSCPITKALSILPVNGVTVSTAVKGRSRKITAQVLIPFTLLGQLVDGIFLVIPHLATSVILGDDWLTEHGVILNYLSRQIEFPRWGLSCNFKPDNVEVPVVQVSPLKVHYSISSILDVLIPDECFLSNASKTIQFINLSPSHVKKSCMS
jgi:hypothetical protein